MAIVKIELDLDWIGENGNVDQHIKDEVISELQSRFTSNIEHRMNKMLNEKLETVASKVTDEFLAKVMSDKIENLQIPHKSDEWRSEVEMLSIGEFVGKKYERFLQKKVLNENGEIVRYERDAKYSIHEYFTNQYLAKELVGKVGSMIKQARQDAEETVLKSLEQNLRQQLSADIINRLNIPGLLKSLQEKAVLLESEQSE